MAKAKKIRNMVIPSFTQTSSAPKQWYRTGVSNLRPAGWIRPAKQNHPARRPFTKLW